MHKPSSPPLTKEYLRYLGIERGLSPNTITNYGTDLAQLTNYAYHLQKKIQDLTNHDLQRWIGELTRTGLSPATVRRMTSAARGFYIFLAIDKHITTLPTEDLDTPHPVSYLPAFLTQLEVDQLLAAPDLKTQTGIRDRAILELMYAAGLRVSELVSLRQQNVDLRDGLVTCLGKGRKERTIPIGKSAIHALQNYIATKRLPRAIKLHLFLNHEQPLTRQFVWSIIQHYSKLADIKHISPHTLRHTFATHMLENGAETKYLQALLGHSSLATTQIYTHVSQRYLRRSYDSHHPRARALPPPRTPPFQPSAS